MKILELENEPLSKLRGMAKNLNIPNANRLKKETLAMMIREFDLSVAGVFSLAGCLMAYMGGSDPALGFAAALLAGACAAHPEDALEDIGEGRAEVGIEALSVATAMAVLERGVAEPIVASPLFFIAEDFVGLGRFFEFGDGFVVARVFIGVIANRQFAIRRRNFSVARRASHFEHFVIIAFGHALEL